MAADNSPPGSVRLDTSAKVIIVLGGMLAALAMTAINSVLPLIDSALAHTPQDKMLVKQLVGAVGLAMVVGAALSGFLVDRIGLRPVMFVASLIYVIAGTAGLYLSDLWALLGSRLLLGLAAATIQIASFTLINTRLEGEQRARWMGFHISFAMIGTIIVHPVAGNLGEFSWRYPFALYLLGVVLIIGLVIGRASGTPSATDQAATALPSRRPRQDKLAWPSWFPFHYLPLAILIGSIVFLPAIYMPFLMKGYGASTSTISYVLTADSIAGAVMALLYGRARRYLSVHTAFLFSFAIVAAGVITALLAATLTGVIAGMVIFGFGVGWLVPNLITSLGDKVAKKRQGKAAGFVKAAHFLAAPIAVAVTEPITHRFGQDSSFVLVAIIAISLVVLTLVRMALSRSRTHQVDALS